MLSMRAGLVSCSVSWLHVSDLVTGRGQNLPICKTHFGSNFWEVSKMSASTGNYFLPVIRSCRTGCNTDITYWKNSLKCMCLSPRTDDGWSQWSQCGQHFPDDACVALFEAVSTHPCCDLFHSWMVRVFPAFVQDVVPLWTWQRCWPWRFGNGFQRYFLCLVPSKTLSHGFFPHQFSNKIVFQEPSKTLGGIWWVIHHQLFTQSLKYTRHTQLFPSNPGMQWQAERFGGRDWLRGMWGVVDRCRRFWRGDSAPWMALSSTKQTMGKQWKTGNPQH